MGQSCGVREPERLGDKGTLRRMGLLARLNFRTALAPARLSHVLARSGAARLFATW